MTPRILKVLFGLALGSLFCPMAAAAGGVSDPGFAFVDVDGDGLYSASSGDIGFGSTPSVDIDSLIQSGSFNAQVSQGAYIAPSHAVSLVIPPSQRFNLNVPLTLKCGSILRMYGQFVAPEIHIVSGAAADLTGSVESFGSRMDALANGDVRLDGATILGSATASQLVVSAQGVIDVQPGNGFLPSIATENEIAFASASGITLTNAVMSTAAVSGDISIKSPGDVHATSNCSLSSGGTVEIVSTRGNANLLGSVVSGTGITLTSNRNTTYTGSALAATNGVTIQAGLQAAGNNAYTAIAGGSINVQAGVGVDVANCSMQASNGSIILHGIRGGVRFDSALLQASQGLTAHGYINVSGIGGTIEAGSATSLTSDTGAITVTQSTIGPFETSSGVTLALVAPGQIAAQNSHWNVPGSITVTSTSSNILASGSTLNTGNAGDPIALTADGGLIDVTGSTLLGAVSYNPIGVHVLGP